MTTPPDPSRDENVPVKTALAASSSVARSADASQPDISVTEMTPQATAAHPAAGHETSDVHIPLILKSLVAILVLIILSAVGLNGLAGYFRRVAERADPPRSPMAESQTPPLPRLETAPRDALVKFRAAETARLSEYRWIDRSKQTVEIPIERAIQLLAERGIPAPAGPAASDTGAATTSPQAPPTDSQRGSR